MIHDYPDPPEAKEAHICPICGAEMVGYDHTYLVDDEYLCPACFMERVLQPEFVTAHYSDDEVIADALADALNIDVWTAEEALKDIMGKED